MFDSLQLVFSQVMVLFLLILAGAVCRWLRLLDEKSVKGMVNVLILLVTPSLIIDVFQRPFERALLEQFCLAFVIAATMHVVLIAIAHFTARGNAADEPVLKLATVFSNAGFMGIPLEKALLGDKGVFFGIVYVAMFNVFMWSWGLLTMRGKGGAAGGAPRSGEWRTALINPGTVSIAVGMPLFLCSAKLPAMVAAPVGMLAALNTPLAMLVIGFYLAGADLRRVARSGAAWRAAAIRLIASPLLLMAALWPLAAALDRTMMLALTVAAAAPSGAMVTMFAARFARNVELSVGLVSGTTLISILTMPPLIALAMALLPA